MNTTESEQACAAFYTANSDLVGIGVRLSVYSTMTICIITAMAPFKNDYVLRTAKVALSGGIAINIVILIAYCQRGMSYKNYAAAMCLGHGMSVAGGYAVILRYRYPVPRTSKVARKLLFVVVVCGMAACAAAFLNLSAKHTHRWPSPTTCNAGNEVPFSSTGYNIPSVIVPILSALSVVSAGWPVHKRRPRLWWRLSVVTILVWEAVGIAVVESGSVLYPGVDHDYGSEAAKWTLGQMLSVLGVMVLILDLIQHAWKFRNDARRRGQLLSMFDTPSASQSSILQQDSQESLVRPLQRSTTWPYYPL